MSDYWPIIVGVFFVVGCCVIANRIEEISDAWRKEWQRRG